MKLWRSSWRKLIPFLDYDAEVRRVICSTKATDLLNPPARRPRTQDHFPTDQAALKCLHLPSRSLDPTGRGRAR